VFDPLELTREVIRLTGERWANASRFTGLATQMGVTDTAGQIAFLTGLKSLMREIPVKVYADPDTRDALMKALQGALDEAIEREREEEGA
jgi:type III secretion protein W